MSNKFWVGRKHREGLLWKIIILKAIPMAKLDFDRNTAE